MRWRLYIEEYSPDLRYIKGTHNIVADALSRLKINDTPFEDTQESFLGLMECFDQTPDAPFLEDFHGGGKTTSLVCYKKKIVIPERLQRHVIM